MKTLNISTACFVNKHQELLVVRKQKTTVWMLPGGKLDDQESPSEALIREIREELQITVGADALTLLGCFEATAANEIDTRVLAHAYIATLPSNQQPQVSAEIAEMNWLPLHEPFPVAIAPLLETCIIPALKKSIFTAAAAP